MIRFLIDTRWKRVAWYVALIPLSAFYLMDVIELFDFYWGRLMPNVQVCQRKSSENLFYQLTEHLQHVLPLVWTIVLAVTLIML